MTSSGRPPSPSLFRHLLPFLWPKRFSLKIRVISCLFFLLASKATLLTVPFFYKKIVDTLESSSFHSGVFSSIFWLTVAYGSARALSVGFTEIRDRVFSPVEQHALREISRKVFEHLHELSLRFHLERKTGSLGRSIERGTRSIENFFRFLLFHIIPTFLEIILLCAILLVMYPPIFSAITFFTLFFYILFSIFISEWRSQFFKKLNQASNATGAQITDSLLNYTTVKYFNNEKYEAKKLDSHLQEYEKIALKNGRSLSYLNFGQSVITSLGLILVIWFSSENVQSGHMTLGDFVLVNSYLLQVYSPLHILGFAYREVKQAVIDMGGLFDLFSIHQEVQDRADAVPLKITDGTIHFRNVSFGYSPQRQILKNISFTIPAGKTVAIVGTSGAGKSTLLNLLFRFFDPEEGEIKIDGQNIRDCTQTSLRQEIGIVPQDTILFNGTVYENILYGNLSATEENVTNAAKGAHIHQFLNSLPHQYHTLVGERGLKLSGGEKQRVAIARVLLKNPKIFVFDEATSSLDTQTEKSIQEDLDKISKGHTTLIIAHRLSTIVEADKIIVLHDGQIIEEGHHHSLLTQKGFYANLWEKQQKKNT